jgi:hypothetical protein
MNDIVSREIADSLRFLGFDDPCVAYYDGDLLKVEKHFFNELNLNSTFKKREIINPHKVSAPNIGQAFRFLRKLGWYYEIYTLENGWEYYIQNQHHSWIEEGFEDDDTCELRCLERIIDIQTINNSKPTLSEEEKIRQLKNIFDHL